MREYTLDNFKYVMVSQGSIICVYGYPFRKIQTSRGKIENRILQAIRNLGKIVTFMCK